MTDTLALGSPWAPYGLRDDPFFQLALQPTTDTGAPRPITLFVGRDKELTRVANQILGSSNSRAILEGDAGVGKTSFVSRLKTELGKHGVLMHAQPVRVRPGMSAREFVAEVLQVLLQIRATVAANEAGGALRKAGRAVKKEALGALADPETVFWRRVGRLVQGEDSTSTGLSAGVPLVNIGAQREQVRIPAEVDGLSLFTELEQAVNYLTQSGKRKLLIHVNNLEQLSQENAASAAHLMQQVRDYLLVDYCHWLFVGTTGVEELVFRASEQVSGIIPFAVALEPLAPREVLEILERRYAHLRMGLRFTAPITPEDGATLYERYHGQLRSFLRLLSRAVQDRATYAPGTTLSVDEVIASMAPTLRRETLIKRLGEADTEHLARMFGGRRFDAEIRVSDLVAATRITQASASKLVRRLLDKKVIRQSRTQGKSVYYRLAEGDITVALNLD